MAISTNGAIITRLSSALYGEYLSNATYNEVISTAPATLAATFLANDFAGKTDAQLAKTILTNLGLTSITGLDNWLAAQLTAAGSTTALKGAKIVSIMNDYANLTTDATYGTYATSFNAKVSAGLVKSQTSGSAGGAYSTADAVSVSDSTFTLTTGVDKFTGSAGNDTFTSSLSSTTMTLSSQDTLDGGAGTDVMYAVVTGSVTPGKISNIETFNISGGGGTLNLSTSTGVTTVNNAGSTSAQTFSAVPNTSIVFGISDVDNVLTTITYPSTVIAGTSDSATVNVSNVTGTGGSTAGIDIAGIENLTINSTTTASTFAAGVTDSSLKKLIITGDAALTLTAALPATAVTVDASGTTGGATVVMTTTTATITGGAGNDSVSLVTAAGTTTANLGAGNDTVTFNGTGTLTTADTIDGGAGTDTISNTNAQINSLTSAGATLTYLTNFETVKVSDAITATATYDLTLFGSGINKLSVAGGTSTAALNATMNSGTSTLSVGGSTASTLAAQDLSITAYGNATTDAVTISNANTSAAISSAAAVTGTGVETLTISDSVSDSSAWGAISLTGTGGTATKLVLTGSKATSVGVVTAGTIDGSGLTASTASLTMTSGSNSATNVTGGAGNDTLYGASTVASTLTGGSGDDSIVGGTGNDKLYGGDGADTITASSGSDTVDGGAGNDTIIMGANLSASDSIIGGDGTDTLSISSAISTRALGARITGIEKIEASSAITQDLSLLSSTVLSTVVSDSTTTGSTSFTNASAGDFDITVLGTGQTAVSLARLSDGAADTLSLTLGKTSTAAGTVATVTAESEDTINIASKGGANTISTLDAISATKLVVTGTKALTITNLQQGGDAYGLGAAVIDLSASSGAISITYGTAYSGDTYNGYYGSTVTSGSGALTYSGTYGKDSVTGSVAADSIVGGIGNDTIDGGAGNDTIQGGAGADVLTGGDGVDTYEVNYTSTSTKDGGTTTIVGEVVNLGSTAITVATIVTATGTYTSGQVSSVASGSSAHLFSSDAYSASANVDTLSGFENITGGSGNDYLVGSSAANTIYGGGGSDTISAGSGNDYVSVSTSSVANTISGGAGDDTIVGGTGADSLNGGSGADSMTGGSGADTFVFTTSSTGTPSSTNYDEITDYTSGTDFISFGTTYPVIKFATAVSSASGTAGVTVTTGVTSFNAADSTLALRIVAVAAALADAAAGNSLLFQYGSDSYLFYSDGTTGVTSTDVLVKLTGITGTGNDEMTLTSGKISSLG